MNIILVISVNFTKVLFLNKLLGQYKTKFVRNLKQHICYELNIFVQEFKKNKIESDQQHRLSGASIN